MVNDRQLGLIRWLRQCMALLVALCDGRHLLGQQLAASLLSAELILTLVTSDVGKVHKAMLIDVLLKVLNNL